MSDCFSRQKGWDGLILALGGIATDILVSSETEPKPGTDIRATIQVRPGEQLPTSHSGDHSLVRNQGL
jgi:hypothetical protein